MRNNRGPLWLASRLTLFVMSLVVLISAVVVHFEKRRAVICDEIWPLAGQHLVVNPARREVCRVTAVSQSKIEIVAGTGYECQTARRVILPRGSTMVLLTPKTPLHLGLGESLCLVADPPAEIDGLVVFGSTR